MTILCKWILIVIITLFGILIKENNYNDTIFDLFGAKTPEKYQLRKRNFASASAGAVIIHASATWKEGYSEEAPGAIIALKPFDEVGECWPMKGASGHLKVQLAQECYISSFTLEHIEPFINLSECIGEVPRNFSVYGALDETDGGRHFLGTYSYNINGPRSQLFEVQNNSLVPFWVVDLNILSNYGNPHYTCIYRFQVHGHMTACLRN